MKILKEGDQCLMYNLAMASKQTFEEPPPLLLKARNTANTENFTAHDEPDYITSNDTTLEKILPLLPNNTTCSFEDSEFSQRARRTIKNLRHNCLEHMFKQQFKSSVFKNKESRQSNISNLSSSE